MNYKNLKELEDDIKKESNKIDVPDVYHKVKDSPIRKLKKGENPTKYFSRKAGITLLAFLTIILIILSILFLAMVLSDTNTTPEFSPVVCSISVTQDGTTKDYIMLCENTGSIKYAINCTTNMLISSNEKQLSNILESLVTPKDNDKLTLSLISSNADLKSNLLKETKNSITTIYDGILYSLSEISTDDTMAKLITYINTVDSSNQIESNADIFTIYSKLTTIAEKSI